MVLAGQRSGEERARGGIDPVGVEVNELQIVLFRHDPRGTGVAHHAKHRQTGAPD